MITLETAENALKEVYLGVVSNTLNVSANPLLTKIKQSNSDVWGKEIIKMAPFGINGGIGAGTETGALPIASNNNYVQFRTDLKNLYGTIEISDKAMRASQNNAGAFVNLLNAEMEGLIGASVFNLGRMLYSDGSGMLATVIRVEGNIVYLSNTNTIMEGMIIEFVDNAMSVIPNLVRRIVAIDRTAMTITLDTAISDSSLTICAIVVQNSFQKEITGVEKILSATGSIYGLDKEVYPWLRPYVDDAIDEITDLRIQTAIDTLEEETGSVVDFISCPSKIKRYYQEYLSTFRRNIDYMNLEGGFKAMSYAGVPIVSDKFATPDTMYLLNTKSMTLHQLCDWQWLEGEDGRIIKQKQGFPVYYATLVKYADLICDKPNGQAKICNIVHPSALDNSSQEEQLPGE